MTDDAKMDVRGRVWARKETLMGRWGLRLELDADAIIPHDPGDGTPAMVVQVRGGREIGSSTFTVAEQCGELDDRPMTDAESRQVEQWGDAVDAFFDQWLPVRIAEERQRAKAAGPEAWLRFERALAGISGDNKAELSEAAMLIEVDRIDAGGR